jgi:hypothetical protein
MAIPVCPGQLTHRGHRRGDIRVDVDGEGNSYRNNMLSQGDGAS